MKAISSNGFVRSNVSRKAQRTRTAFMNAELCHIFIGTHGHMDELCDLTCLQHVVRDTL